uniref:Uncharacterized protein n=1 Tax=Buteo japonicus TaxID=224669 RepID=A0A8C0AN19_9AVES
VHDDQEGWTGHQDELQGPEANVGDGEEVVVADVGAARLPRVAVKVLVVVAPDPLGRHHVDQQAEDEDHGEPDAAEGCGVLVDPAQEPFEHPPVHGPLILLASLGGERRHSADPGLGGRNNRLSSADLSPYQPQDPAQLISPRIASCRINAPHAAWGRRRAGLPGLRLAPTLLKHFTYQ